MSLLVLGVSHQSAPWTSWRRWPPSTSDRPCRWSAPVTLWAKPCCCRPATASRCTPRSPDSTPLWNRSPRFWPRVPGCRRTNCPPTCTSTTRMPRSGMPSGSPVASTRWSWAMSRSWGSSGRRSGGRRARSSRSQPARTGSERALRVGKRVQTDTAIGRHGASVVEVALAQARRHFGTLAGRHVVILGSGSMSSLAASVSASQGARVTIVGARPRRFAVWPKRSAVSVPSWSISTSSCAAPTSWSVPPAPPAAGHPRAPAEGAGGEPQPVRVRPRPAA